ncbi:uncharacterized protein PgNI_04710 [Pyricularia grisea]|uniref:Protein DSF2 n=1 Tax=Pyricularia grisea TaxID=148305 RepID=A0A6P8BCE8_PYRGI|nr:uncharacterized protein PgNI_04710 [Pyricularia grisea]TLD13444.1 hypothetical protein PgNI_04710 [Pyricularia grisea]
MGLRDMLKKKDYIDADGPGADKETVDQFGAQRQGHLRHPVTFIRTDTFNHEVIQPPGDPAEEHDGGRDRGNSIQGGENNFLSPDGSKRRSFFSSGSPRSRGSSVSSAHSPSTDGGHKDKEKVFRRLSQRLHLARSPPSSEHVPQNLPEIVVRPEDEANPALESKWEERATILAMENERVLSRPPSPPGGGGSSGGDMSSNLAQMSIDDHGGPSSRKRSPSAVSSKAVDDNIQEAIRLHESGELERSTMLFGKLADPEGDNNPLSQVLYGLALRHGWGCQPDPEGAVHYLSKAASNAATVETLALQAGMKKGGAAKGELVLAIFELANCFRHGWGVQKDPVAAKQYYETAANLGDTDAMNEVAWCYLEGFGCKKDKFASAKYYRLAEKSGSKTLGNSWIWKEKYDPGYSGKKK